MFNKKALLFGIILTLAIIVTLRIALTPVPDETSLPIIVEIQGEPELLMLESPSIAPAEIMPFVTTTPIISVESPVISTTASVTNAEPPVTTTPIVTTTSPPPTTTATPVAVNAPERSIEGNGYSFYRDSDGRLDLDWMVAPSGEVVSYEEYVFRMKNDPPKPDGTQWIDDGQHFKIVDEQMYVWHDVVGWCETGGIGTVTIMDVQSDGHMFYVEPDGKVNLSKIITPNGDIISYEEYKIIRESR